MWKDSQQSDRKPLKGLKHQLRCILAILALLTIRVQAQQNKTVPAWILPGISYRYSDIFRATAQYGILTHRHVNVIYLQSFIKVSKHLVLNPGYIHLDFHTPGLRKIREHTLINGIIFTTKPGSFVLEDRNMFWHRFRNHEEDIHIYRNRLRGFLQLRGKLQQTRLYAYDEAWILLSDPGWMRNRAAFGMTSDILTWFNIDVSYVREWDKINGRSHLFFIMGTFLIVR